MITMIPPFSTMADSTSTPSTFNNAISTVADSSCFGHTVCLYDWWLIKAENDFEGKWLAVSGTTSRKEKAFRVFVSAPVAKRHDVFSLETADGIYIMIKGFINEQRTLENGFPPEVFSNFIFGFPPNWESFAGDWFRREPTTGIDLGSAVPENISPSDPEVLSDENSAPSSSKSPEVALGAHEKSFPKEECHLSKETMGGFNVAHGRGSSRHCARLHNIKVCQQKKPASGVAWKHPEKQQHSSSGALENPNGEGLENLMAPIQSQSLRQVNTPSKQLVKNSSSAFDSEVLFDEKSVPTSSKSQEEALGVHEKSFPREECHLSKVTMGGVNVSHGSGSNRRSRRLHNIKVCQQHKLASGVSRKLPDKEQHSSSRALGNPDGEGLESPMTPVQSQSPAQVNTRSKQLVKNSASRVSRPFYANDEGCSKKQKVTVETKVITPKRKKTRSASAIIYPQERDQHPLIKGGKKEIFSVSPLSSSFRKSRFGRLLLPPLEFWRNQIAIYNADHEITEIQEGSSLVSPFKACSTCSDPRYMYLVAERSACCLNRVKTSLCCLKKILITDEEPVLVLLQYSLSDKHNSETTLSLGLATGKVLHDVQR